jgi:hypothetical protein
VKIETTKSEQTLQPKTGSEISSGKNQGYAGQTTPGKTTFLLNCGNATLVTQKLTGRFLKSWNAGNFSVNRPATRASRPLERSAAEKYALQDCDLRGHSVYLTQAAAGLAVRRWNCYSADGQNGNFLRTPGIFALDVHHASGNRKIAACAI